MKPEDDKQFVVEGYVRRAAGEGQQGEPVVGVVVHAFDRDLVDSTPLGQGETDELGKYTIPFPESAYIDGDVGYAVPDELASVFRNVAHVSQPKLVKSGPDLWVGIKDASGEFVTKSEVVYNAGARTTIDLILAEPERVRDSDLEELLREVLPRLKGLTLDTLTREQIAFLGKGAEISLDGLQALVAGSKWLTTIKDLAGRHGETPGKLEFPLLAATYAFQRTAAGGDLAVLIGRGEAWWSDTIARAIEQKWIPETVELSRKAVVELLARVRAWLRLEPAAGASPASLGDLLTSLPPQFRLELNDRRVLSSVVDTHGGDVSKVRAELKEKGWQAPRINAVVRTIGLGVLTEGHAPLVAALQSKDPDESSAALLDLAGHGRKEWEKLVDAAGVPASAGAADPEARTAYVDRLLRGVEQRMPSAYLSARIRDGRIGLSDQARQPVLTFFEKNPGLRLGEEPVIQRFLEPGAATFDEIRDEDLPLVRDEVLRMDRVVRLSPSLEVAEHLFADGYASARQVTRSSREVFIDTMAGRLPGGKATAERTYDAASGIVEDATALLMTRSPLFNRNPELPVMPVFRAMPAMGAPAGVAAAAMEAVASPLTATLETLFGNQDYCECDGCASMYSAGAYLVELFQLLERGARNGAGRSALDVLLERRPDLAEIELTCDNTDVTLPYTDIVLEVLESWLARDAFWNRFARGTRDAAGNIVSWGFDPELDAGRMPPQLQADLRDAGLDLGSTPTVRKIANTRWLVRGGGWRLQLFGRANPNALGVIIYPQSSAGAAADEVVPRQYVYWAYDQLRVPRFPWTLPFDLSHEETGEWLKRLKVERREIVDAYAGTSQWQSFNSACAVLGIGDAERPLFFAAATDPHTDWGFATPSMFDPAAGANRDWNVMLRQVSRFRRRAGVTHRELLQLLETTFVQGSPGLAGPLRLSGDECDSDLMRLGDDLPGGLLTASVLRRIFLFVRLRRKLTWSALDLDRALRAHGAAVVPAVLTGPPANSSEERLTESFIIYASNIVRLRKATTLPVETIVNLFRPTFDTRSYWDHARGEVRLAASFYERRFNSAAVARPRTPGLELNAQRDELQPVLPGQEFPRLRVSDYASECAAAMSVRPDDILAVLPRGTVSIAPVEVGRGAGAPIDGHWVDLTAADVRQIEWIVGQPSDTTSEFRITVQELDAAGAVTDVGGPTLVTRGTNDWRRVVTPYAGTGRRLRVRVERTAGAGRVWLSARVLTSDGLGDDRLTLANLTRACSHAALARALKIPARDYVTFIQISGINPLAGPARALECADVYRKATSTGVRVPELDYLLRHRFSKDVDLAQTSARVVRMLSTFRSRMQADAATLVPAAGKAADLVQPVLLELGWPDRLVDLVLGPAFLDVTVPAIYAGAADPFPAALVPVLPQGLTYESSVKQLELRAQPRRARAEYDAAVVALRATAEYGALSNADQTRVDDALTAIDAAVTVATQQLQPLLDPLVRLAQSITLPVHSADYPAGAVPAPEEIAIPAEWSGVFWYEPADEAFKFRGPMEAAWRDDLLQLSNGAAYQQALAALFAAAAAYQEAVAANRLIVRETNPVVPGVPTADRLLGELPSLEERSLDLIDRLRPVVVERRAKAAAAAILGDEFALEPDQAEVLVDRFRHDDQGTSRPLVARNAEESWLLAAAFVQSDQAVVVSATAFPAQSRAIERLAKVALITSKVGFKGRDAEWLLGQWQPALTRFDFADLPIVAVTGAAAGWTPWVQLATLASCRAYRVDSGPIDLAAINRVLSSTDADGDKFEALSPLLGASPHDLSRLAADLGAAAAADLLAPDTLARAIECLGLMRRTGADAATLDLWRQPATSPALAAKARQLARAIIGEAQWATASRPVLDALRTKRREAIVDYWVHRLELRDANDLYGELLLDPEMGPAMLTSRMVQGISSVQLFIHRVLMNLENRPAPDDVAPSAIDKTHWDWMKKYRVWEANRKVLLYPENWIEPDLRTDQTPPFVEATSQASQGDLTADGADLVIRDYVDRLVDLARLEPVGMCSEYDGVALKTTHVFGRTRSEPAKYFYRQFRKLAPAVDATGAEGDWTPWQTLNVEIEGEHVVPVIFQGRLFVFWPTFTEHAEDPGQSPPAAGATPAPGLKPRKFWILKFAWSERKEGTWTPRRVTTDNALLLLPLNVLNWSKDEFYIRTEVQAKGVVLDVYLTPLYLKTDPITTEVDLNKVPVVSLYFDGDDLRLAASYQRYQLGLNRNDQFHYWPADPAEMPITVDTALEVVPHTRMFVTGSRGSFTLPLGATTLPVLKTVPRAYKLLFSPEDPNPQFSAPAALALSRPVPFFLFDSARQFFVYPTYRLVVKTVPAAPPLYFLFIVESEPQLHFSAADHPQAPRLRRTLKQEGVAGLLQVPAQTEPLPPAGVRGTFSVYGPEADVVATQPLDDIALGIGEPAGPFNWELFFHAKLTIACAFTREQRFELARRWFHLIFDPTDASNGSTPERYWNFRPFREEGTGLPIAELVRRLADAQDRSPEKQAFIATIHQWRQNPFEPHLVARLRPRSYMYAVVMKYLDNLIAWGDQLFRRDTMESLNEATQLYILAAQILGRRPEAIPHRTKPAPQAFSDLRGALSGAEGALGNPLVLAENVIRSTGGTASGTAGRLPQTLYFCVPNNPKLLEYYDTIADRLFKLRNSMNIDGVVRQLPLFEPPIDPGMLVRARAAGVDLASALADMNAPLPLYRFTVMTQKASELCNEVKSLGAALLAALEKRDGEALARLRSQHELRVLADVRTLKEMQIEEARANVVALAPALESAQARLAYYVGLVSQLESMTIPSGPAGPSVESVALAAVETVSNTLSLVQTLSTPMNKVGEVATEMLQKALARASEAISETLPEPSGSSAKVPMNAAEKRNLQELKQARDEQAHASDLKAAARFFAMIPDFNFGTSGVYGSPVVTFSLGGTLLSKAAELFATVSEGAAAEHTYRATQASLLATYQRRAADWIQQAVNAQHEIDQITKQVAAAGLRAAIAAQDLRNHDRQIENATEADELLRSKFTNQELYTWMTQQISGVYFRSYQLAYDVAKRAERAFRNELGTSGASFVNFGYWDGLKKGLMAGEQLFHDIKRMEVAYLDQNRRELEITRHISLRQLDALALARLRTDGVCEFELPEALFDLDFAGHYFRRVKTVSVSVPCVVGPYTSVSGTLTLLSSKLREKTIVAGEYGDEENYRSGFLPIQSIAVSGGQNDSGTFQLDFRDERYLPFEGAGAISRWRFTLPEEFRAFDYDTISDLVIHLRYTARDGGGTLAAAARGDLAARLNALTHDGTAGLVELIPLRQDFAIEWRRYRDQQADLTLQLTEQQFPYMFRTRVAPQSAALLWKGQRAQRAVQPDAGDGLPSYTIPYAAGDELLTVADPYLLVVYQV